MKKIIYLSFSFFAILSCNNSQQSAFVGDIVKTTDNVGTLSEESIYNLSDTFTTQDNHTVRLKDFAGKPTVICMIFTHCTYACPRLTADVKKIEEQLGKDAGKANFVLVSFDSERDTPEQLKHFQKEMNLDNHFTLLHGNDDAVRTLSVLLNVQFQKNSDGDFSHSNIISILDKEGKLTLQKEGINASQQETVSRLKEMMNGDKKS